MLPGMMNNGGHKVGAQWVRLLLDHGHEALLANTNGDPCQDFWDFTVPVCSFAEVIDSSDNVIVWNWGDDLRKRMFHHAKQYYYAQDCCQPHYPGNDFFMPLIKGLRMITIGHHSEWFYRYTQGIGVVGVVNNFVDQNVFKYDVNKHLDSRAFNVCMMEHREHWNPSFISQIQNLGFNLIVAKGTQAQVAEAINKSAYFVSFAEGVQTPHGKIEGFPLPTAEAMAAGCITLAMDNGGNTEYLLDSVNGFFHTGVESAVEIIRQLMLDSSDRKSFIAENAYRTFKHRFNKERTYSQIKKALSL
jgi:glycosyltransferase involved in cell wall biosynthesis